MRHQHHSAPQRRTPWTATKSRKGSIVRPTAQGLIPTSSQSSSISSENSVSKPKRSAFFPKTSRAVSHDGTEIHAVSASAAAATCSRPPSPCTWTCPPRTTLATRRLWPAQPRSPSTRCKWDAFRDWQMNAFSLAASSASRRSQCFRFAPALLFLLVDFRRLGVGVGRGGLVLRRLERHTLRAGAARRRPRRRVARRSVGRREWRPQWCPRWRRPRPRGHSRRGRPRARRAARRSAPAITRVLVALGSARHSYCFIWIPISALC